MKKHLVILAVFGVLLLAFRVWGGNDTTVPEREKLSQLLKDLRSPDCDVRWAAYSDFERLQ